jgi:thioester reductase-like protein
MRGRRQGRRRPFRGHRDGPERFRAAVQKSRIGESGDIPHLIAPIIVKYISGLQLLGLL